MEASKNEHAKALCEIAVGAVAAIGALLATSFARALLRWPGWHDVDASSIVTLGLPCVVVIATAMRAEREAHGAAIRVAVGSLAALPLAAFASEGTADPSLVAVLHSEPHGFAQFVLGSSWLCASIPCAAALSIVGLATRVARPLLAVAATIAVASSVVGSAWAAFTPATARLGDDFGAYVDGVPSVPRDATPGSGPWIGELRAVAPPPFFERAYAVTLRGDDRVGDSALAPTERPVPGAGVLRLERHTLRWSGGHGGCYVPETAHEAVIAHSARGLLVLRPGRQWDAVCSLANDSFSRPWLPASSRRCRGPHGAS